MKIFIKIVIKYMQKKSKITIYSIKVTFTITSSLILVLIKIVL